MAAEKFDALMLNRTDASAFIKEAHRILASRHPLMKIKASGFKSAKLMRISIKAGQAMYTGLSWYCSTPMPAHDNLSSIRLTGGYYKHRRFTGSTSYGWSGQLTLGLTAEAAAGLVEEVIAVQLAIGMHKLKAAQKCIDAAKPIIDDLCKSPVLGALAIKFSGKCR